MVVANITDLTVVEGTELIEEDLVPSILEYLGNHGQKLRPAEVAQFRNILVTLEDLRDSLNE